jgi:hypothetical protein
VIELPVVVRAQPDEVVQGVHNRDRCVERESRQRTSMGNLDVLVVPAVDTPSRKRREVLTPSVLPQASVPASRVVGSVGDGTNRE